jgi:hypothetical protein
LDVPLEPFETTPEPPVVVWTVPAVPVVVPAEVPVPALPVAVAVAAAE